eukprot:1147717-Pelagomonas_calceolata.AAC.1
MKLYSSIWFRAAVRLYNALLRSNSTTLSKVLQAYVDLSCLFRKCWASEFLATCMSLDRCNTITPCAHSGQPIFMREFVVGLRKSLQGVWNADRGGYLRPKMRCLLDTPCVGSPQLAVGETVPNLPQCEPYFSPPKFHI